MRDSLRNLYLEERYKFWSKNGEPTGFVIHHRFFAQLTESLRICAYVRCQPLPDKCPKFEGMNVYRTSDGPEDFIRFF